MSAVAYTSERVFHRGMTSQTPKLTEAQIHGLALKRLRQRYDMSQKAAAEHADTYQQTWQRYESGGTDALLKPTLQRRLAEALGASHEEFLIELAQARTGESPRDNVVQFAERPLRRFEFEIDGRARMGPAGVQIYDDGQRDTIDLSHVLGPGNRLLRLAGESMYPYAEDGGFVTYNVNRFPRRGQGCVIAMNDGAFFVKRFERTDGQTLHVTEYKMLQLAEGTAYLEAPRTFELAEVRGIYALGVRGE